MPVIKRQSYILTIAASIAAPADATTYYIYNVAADATTADKGRIVIPRQGIITNIRSYWRANGVAGTNEATSLYIRLNNTTDTLIATLGDTNATKLFTNTALTIPVIPGDYFQLKLVCPTWVTNPTTVQIDTVVEVSV